MSEEEKQEAVDKLKRFPRPQYDALECHLLTGHTFTELWEAKVVEPVMGIHEVFVLKSGL